MAIKADYMQLVGLKMGDCRMRHFNRDRYQQLKEIMKRSLLHDC